MLSVLRSVVVGALGTRCSSCAEGTRWYLQRCGQRVQKVISQIRAMGPCGRLADSALLAALAQHGAAVLQDFALPGAINNCPRGMMPSLDWPNRASARRLTSNVYFVAGLCTACFFMASGSRIFSTLKSPSRAHSRLSPSPVAHFTSPLLFWPIHPCRAENLDLGHFRRVSRSPFLSGPVRGCLCRRFACSSLRLAQERLLHSLRTHSKSRF